MIVYHGSQEIVELPIYGKGKIENDYGRGFYCTESAELAKEWACPILKDGFSNQYELDIDGLKVLDLNGEGFHILNWLALLLQNRKFDISKNKTLAVQGREYILENFLPDISGYDIIKGYRADDRYFAYAKDFIQGGIPVRTLADAMRLGELGEQIVLVSAKSFQKIHFIKAEQVDSGIYHNRKTDRENRANEAFNVMHNETVPLENDLYILDIIRQGVKNDDSRLR